MRGGGRCQIASFACVRLRLINLQSINIIVFVFLSHAMEDVSEDAGQGWQATDCACKLLPHKC